MYGGGSMQFDVLRPQNYLEVLGGLELRLLLLESEEGLHIQLR